MMRTIRWRIAVPYVVLIMLLAGSLAIFLSSFIRQTYLNDLTKRQTSEAHLISETLGPLLAEQVDSVRMDQLTRRWGALIGERVTVISPDGTVLGESHDDRTQMDNHLNRPEVAQALSSGEGTSTRFSNTLGTEMMYTAIAIQDGDRVIGVVRLAMPLQQIETNLSVLRRTLTGATLGAAILATLIAIYIASRTTQPLRALTEAAGKMAAGDIQHKIIPATPDEIGQLTRAFNAMAAQLAGKINTLEREGNKLSAVLQQMTDGVVIADAEGHIQLLNPAAERMFGVEEKQALGRTLAEVLRHYQFVDIWKRSRETNELQAATLDMGLNRLYLQGVAIPLEQADPGNTLLLIQDLTRLRHLETVRRDFVSNISHELRTPLAALKALTETLLDSALDDPPAARRFLQQMETEVDSLSLMVTELLELARIESGRVPLQFKAVSPLEIITPAIERLSLQAERAGLQVTQDCPPELPSVRADPVRIEQVVVNLLHNAIKFTPAGGRIILAARQEGNEVVFSVQDNGVGIPPDDLPRIFERFYKADRARSGGGTGLGLAIARHLVETHNGRIWAESQVGQGSIFLFSLPVVDN